MKKVKLIKSIAISAPVLITPLIANSCSSKDNKNSKAKYYVDALAQTLKLQLSNIANQVVAAATGSGTLNITSQINTAKTEAKLIAKDMPSNIDKINLTFSGTGNITVTKDKGTYTLTVFPSFINSSSNKQTLTTTLSLTLSSSNKNTQSITNTYDVAKGFKNYTTGLGNRNVNSVYASPDGNIIYAGTGEGDISTAGGVSIGTKSGDTYKFANYSDGLQNKFVHSVYASPDGNTIYAGTGDNSGTGGVAVGTKNADNNWQFANWTIGVGGTLVFSVYASPDGNAIYAGTGNGLSIGIEQSGNTGYIFTNYTTSDGLGDNDVRSVAASPDGSTIYAATQGGVSVGTKPSGSDRYKFTNFTAGIVPPAVNFVYPANNGNTIYAGTDTGVAIGTKESGSNTYTFINSPITDTGIAGVLSLYPLNNGNTVYAATTSGLAVGTKSSSSKTYTFKLLSTSAGLGSSEVNSVYVSNNKSTIYAGTTGGLSISSSNWLTQNNSNYSVINSQPITSVIKNY